MAKRRGWSVAGLVGIVVAVPTPAIATYSIVATDSDSGQVGGAGTSCVGSLDVSIIYGGAPGKGVAHAQARINTGGRDRAVVLLESDTAPADIIAEITDPSFDSLAQQRQYGIADLQGRAAGFTGTQNGAEAGDVQGTLGAFTYSIQGNILTSTNVLTQAEAGFEGAGCDLADRLMLALEAGADNGEGDSRCTGGGIPSDSAFIHVDGADGSEVLHLSVTGSGSVSPLIELRADFDAWRAANPCPGQAPDAGTSAGDDAGIGDNGDDGDSSCGCHTTGRSAGASLALALLVGLALRRRPHRG